ncbi:MAG: Branched-chain amino acid transport ATP-binding protein LivG, partial [Actinomycetia bacterium]|nr:Branched-chain amino acid transport ATP-binding protein LivG [Actinomycetes bacterium]
MTDVISPNGQHGDAPPNRAAPALEVREVSVNIGGIHALTDVSLAVMPGEVLGIIGPNGAGKTTLFDAISGLRMPTSGHVSLCGVDATRRSPVWRSRNGLRRTFQRQQVVGALSVEDNLVAAQDWRGGGGGLLADLFGLRSRARLEKERRVRAAEVLAWCGLTEIASVSAGGVPIGISRMVELGRAVVDDARVLLLDEPTSGLDGEEMEQLGETIVRVVREQNCAVLLV